MIAGYEVGSYKGHPIFRSYDGPHFTYHLEGFPDDMWYSVAEVEEFIEARPELWESEE